MATIPDFMNSDGQTALGQHITLSGIVLLSGVRLVTAETTKIIMPVCFDKD